LQSFHFGKIEDFMWTRLKRHKVLGILIKVGTNQAIILIMSLDLC